MLKLKAQIDIEVFISVFSARFVVFSEVAFFFFKAKFLLKGDGAMGRGGNLMNSVLLVISLFNVLPREFGHCKYCLF